MSDKNNKALSTHEASTVTKRDWVLFLLRHSFHLFHYGLDSGQCYVHHHKRQLKHGERKYHV